MSRSDEEALLWEIGSRPEERDALEVSNETLKNYREGRLSAEDCKQVEFLLAHSAGTRERLVELSGLERARPPAATRDRLLRSLPRQAALPGIPRLWWMHAAAAIVLTLAGYWWIASGGDPGVLPAELEFEVRVAQLADVRSSGDRATAGVLPRTPLEIVVEPRERAVAGLDFGLYVEREGQVERLRPGRRLALETDRGTAVFTGRAADLLGPEPGIYDLLVVVAPEGGLPASRDLAAGESAEKALVAGGGHRVYRQQIRLLEGSVDGGT